MNNWNTKKTMELDGSDDFPLKCFLAKPVVLFCIKKKTCNGHELVRFLGKFRVAGRDHKICINLLGRNQPFHNPTF